MTGNYSNLVYLHDLIESIVEHDVTFIVSLLQVRINDEWARRITEVLYTGKEEKLPNGKRIDVFYKVKTFGKTVCLGFEIKTGNSVEKNQLVEELEGLSHMEGCDESHLVLVANNDPKFDMKYYFVPLADFMPRVGTVLKILDKFV